MRNAFATELLSAAEKNSDIILLTADLGFSVFEKFEEKLPKQYLNTGCSEANTISMAAGLAMAEKKVFVYSIVPFITMRCFEQIRIDLCYHNLDVTVVGVGGGLAYGQLGPTHHAIEDIAIMRALPNMKVLCPADPVESTLLTRALVKSGGPAYLRLNRGGDTVIHANPEKLERNFAIGKAIFFKKGTQMTLITTGAMLKTTLQVAEMLEKKDISTAVLHFPTIKPLDKTAILKALNNTSHLVTIEEHNLIGGLGSAVAEILAENAATLYHFHRFAIPDRFTKEVGNQEYLRAVNHLDAESIFKDIYGKMDQRGYLNK